jgi:hypothetical protein
MIIMNRKIEGILQEAAKPTINIDDTRYVSTAALQFDFSPIT